MSFLRIFLYFHGSSIVVLFIVSGFYDCIRTFIALYICVFMNPRLGTSVAN